MDHATDSTVLGDFQDVQFNHHGVVSVFRRREGKFYVLTEGRTGMLEEFQVKYVFGVDPLQQYLVEFPDGSVQCLPFCWDTRPAPEGGQRWFHIYGDEKIPSKDPLFWTRTSQRWNYMCAECHSTNLKKGHDPATGQYKTTWSEIDVSCEACHGPGSEHIRWAEAPGEDPTNASLGFPARLKKTNLNNWKLVEGKNTAVRLSEDHSSTQMELCARCHSRRALFSEDYTPGKPLLNTHYPSVLREDLYHPDGQVLEEVYEYGSFLQSRMHAKGVVCTDCHDAHSSRLYADGNALCFRCHKAEVFGGPGHHRHKEGSTGSACVECHMPATTFMQVDKRRDHSFRIPRPDLSAKLGTPDACTQCHRDKDAGWAEEQVKRWYGGKGEKHFGETFVDARRGVPAAQDEIILLASLDSIPSIVKATAASLLSQYPSNRSLGAARDALGDPDPLVRVTAISALEMIPPDDRYEMLAPLLHDSVRVVRMFAARALAGITEGLMTQSEKDRWQSVLAEYEASQTLNSDFPSNLMNLANLYLELGETERAEVALKEALRIEPVFAPAYANLADLYRQQQREAEGGQVLLTGLGYDPENRGLNYALGLHDARAGDLPSAVKHLRIAAEAGQVDPRYSYGYAVALNSNGKTADAVRVLQEALIEHPYDKDILQFLVLLHRDIGERQSALVYAARLCAIDPENQEFKNLERMLRESKQ